MLSTTSMYIYYACIKFLILVIIKLQYQRSNKTVSYYVEYLQGNSTCPGTKHIYYFSDHLSLMQMHKHALTYKLFGSNTFKYLLQ